MPAGIAWAVATGADIAPPGVGTTLRRWEVLATAGSQDLSVARMLEPHLDALAILHEAGVDPDPDASWGVYAAEGPGVRLTATRDRDGSWSLDGTKPWCSLAGEVSHALVTAWVDDDARGMFAVDLSAPGVTVDATGWSAYALAEVVTSTTSYDRVPVTAVGGPGWYLDRDGFAWGGIGVAAVWYGGAVGLARRLLEQCRRREPDQVALLHLGAVDAVLASARAVLAASAADIDAGLVSGVHGALAAARVRQVVADACETVLTSVAHALGPGPLAHEPRHARRVADLGLYVRQHHAERDRVDLGRHLLDRGPDGPVPW